MGFSPLIDLASERVGGAVLWANDEAFASRENLVRAAEPIEKDEYVATGKWMDGWETRRRRQPGHDVCLVRLGLRGRVRNLVVDTSFFRGNFPERCSIEACDVRGYPAPDSLMADQTSWFELLAASPLEGNHKNTFTVACDRPVTHLRFRIFPDGGVARLRVLGEVVPDWDEVDFTGELCDLAAASLGARVIDASDVFYGDPSNMLRPGEARDMSDGWETRRRRGPGHDWVVIRLAAPGSLARVEVDTRHFKNNAPGQVALEGASADGLGPEALRDDGVWRPILARTQVLPHTVHRFGAAELAPPERITHVRLHAYPDGGLARLRLWGRTERSERLLVGLGRKNALAPEAMAEELLRVCGSERWAARVAAQAPFCDPARLMAAADRVWRELDRDDILAAFAAHPRIGERKGGAWSRGEQAGAAGAGAGVAAALVEKNRAYEERFGYIYIVCATGKSAEEMLAICEQRLGNDPERELGVAAAEQGKITRLRLVKWLSE